MVRPHAKRPFCADPSVTLQVLRLRRTRFEDEVGIAVERSLIEPQPAHRPDAISTAKRPLQMRCQTKRDQATSTISKRIASGLPTTRKFARSLNTSAFVGTNSTDESIVSEQGTAGRCKWCHKTNDLHVCFL